MSRPLDESYFEWLYSQVADKRLRAKTRTFWSLLRQLYTTEFVWLIPNDDNREADGRELRHEFVINSHIRDADAEWLGLPCSMLEMLIGISRRLAFEAEGQVSSWFWHLLDNLEIAHYNDQYYEPEDQNLQEEIDRILTRVIFRNYNEDGRGGLFPLRDADEDQTEVELWYQLNTYLLEMDVGS